MGFRYATGRLYKPSVVSAGGWWLSGGISAANCIAAYQPIGAASYAASKVNLANPGTYDATEGDANVPTWSSLIGWTGTASAYLRTGIVPSVGWSMIVRYSNASLYSVPCGSRKSTTDSAFYILPDDIDKMYFCNQAVAQIAGTLQSGVLAMAGQDGYENGVDVCDIPTATNTGWYEIYLLARNTAGSATSFFDGGQVHALSFYNTVITPTQVSALTTAINSL